MLAGVKTCFLGLKFTKNAQTHKKRSERRHISRWVVGQGEESYGRFKGFIDVNVETVTNAELVLDNKICHASFTNLQIGVMYCLHYYAVLDISLLLTVFASENIRKT